MTQEKKEEEQKKNTKRKRTFQKEILSFGVAFGVIFLALIGIVSYPVLQKNLDYIQNIAKMSGVGGDSFSCPKKPDPGQENSICIPKIQTKAPIIYGSGATYSDVFDQLKDGVVHASGTALPGEQGNSFLIGHSNDYPWRAGNYKTVFALLDKLEVGDSFFTYRDGTRYEYTVTESFQVNPSELWVLDQPDEGSVMSLMTCWPPSTTLKRLIVKAELQ